MHMCVYVIDVNSENYEVKHKNMDKRDVHTYVLLT